ncbi:alpha/beta hydrolase fold domain-containing protein [Winogradskyella sp. PE311]|uniref:alpha/beta hydrolase fold domain-containing protein n=1 Tax=Winogradskyella sp. PE311 TaxID=3366943 RepID=UPI0039811C79
MIRTFLKLLVLILCFSFINCEQTQSNNKVTNVSKTSYKYRDIDNEELIFDYYRPKQSIENLPLIVYVHGGGFYTGKRDDKNIVNFAHQLVNNNYAMISISYRLTRDKKLNCKTKTKDKIKAFDSVSEDISYAINFILDHKLKLKVDSSKIIIAGTSAGAESILNLVYTTNKAMLPENFKFAGIISRSGAIRSLDAIDKSSSVPIQFFHGTNDALVPYDIGSHHGCTLNEDGYLKLYGSKAIANHLKKINAPYYLVTLKNGDHGMNMLPKEVFLNESLLFLNSIRAGTKIEQTELFY